MSKLRVILPACALSVAALSACQKPAPCPQCPPPPPPVNTAAEADAIRALDRQWVAAIASGDVDAMAAFYADDATFMQPNAEAKTGAAIREAWAELAQLPGVSLSFEPTRIEVDGGGEMAIDIGTYAFSFEPPEGKVEDRGNYLVVWEKRNGQWKVAADMYNSSVPLPAPN